MDSFYNTGCVPLNAFMVWGSLVVITAVVCLLRIHSAKTRLNLEPQPSFRELAVALLVSVVAVVILYNVFKALCTSENGRVVGYVVVGLLLFATAWVTGEVYVNTLAKYEVNTFNYTVDKGKMLGNRIMSFRRGKTPAPAQPAAPAVMVSTTSSEPVPAPRGYNYF